MQVKYIITGLYCDSLQTKYIVLHELAHLKVRNHGKDFIAIMDQYMPYWRETKKLLNELKLDHMDEVEGYDAMHDITCD